MTEPICPDAAAAAARMPGVYFEHRWEHGRPAVGTGIPAFIGFAQARPGVRGAASDCRLLQHWEQFDQLFRDVSVDAYLRHAVHGFFANGGTHCVVVPVKADMHAPVAMAAALMAPLQAGGALEDVTLIDLVCVPDLMLLAGEDTAAAVYDVQNAVLEHCARMENRFALLDVLPGADEGAPPGTAGGESRVAQALRHWETLTAGHGALYFPWLRVGALRLAAAGWTQEPAETVRVPPCGHVAGVFARTDRRAGPHRAPANELLHGVLRLDQELGDAQYAVLNDKGVNCVRSVPGRGIRVWGARTLNGSAEWRYVNVRRLFLTFVRWVEHNCGDLVFEANDAQLQERFGERLRSHCRALFQQGALAGTNPADAFHVKCDAETNPRASIDGGALVAEVGLAPLVPAEFVVVRITQSAGGFSVGMPSVFE